MPIVGNLQLAGCPTRNGVRKRSQGDSLCISPTAEMPYSRTYGHVLRARPVGHRKSHRAAPHTQTQASKRLPSPQRAARRRPGHLVRRRSCWPDVVLHLLSLGSPSDAYPMIDAQPSSNHPTVVMPTSFQSRLCSRSCPKRPDPAGTKLGGHSYPPRTRCTELPLTRGRSRQCTGK